VSTADSRVGIREEYQCGKEPLYADLRDYLTEKQRHWLFTRDIELARPLQQKYLTYEAEILARIHETEREKEITYREQARDMHGATGLAKMSWNLYQLKLELCSKWSRHRLHCRWKHRHLSAKRKELSGEYVRAQTQRRMNILREILYFANEEVVEDRDDGGYVRDGMLNYIVTGYDSIFPISRELDVDMRWA
jgi:hypothetical protein